METVTTWRRNRLAQPHSWSHIDKLRVATRCWRSETHFFTEEVKHQAPGSSLETRAPGSPGHILTLNLPFAFPQPFHRRSAWQHQKTEWKMMKNWSRRARIWKSFTVRGRLTLRNPVSCIFFFLLCFISQGFSLPYRFLLRERVELYTVLITEIKGRGTCLDSFQLTPFSDSF